VVSVGRYLVDVVSGTKRFVDLVVESGTALHVLEEQRGRKFEFVRPLKTGSEGRLCFIDVVLEVLVNICS